MSTSVFEPKVIKSTPVCSFGKSPKKKVIVSTIQIVNYDTSTTTIKETISFIKFLKDTVKKMASGKLSELEIQNISENSKNSIPVINNLLHELEGNHCEHNEAPAQKILSPNAKKLLALGKEMKEILEFIQPYSNLILETKNIKKELLKSGKTLSITELKAAIAA